MAMSCHHVHFVQSLEPLQGGGLGAAALQLHQALRELPRNSTLISTRDASHAPKVDAEEFIRTGPAKAFFAKGMRRRAEELMDENVVVHAHGFYVYPNAAFGAAARRNSRPLVCHPHGMFEPWILRRSPWKKRAAGLLFENANFRGAKLWRALTDAEANQIRSRGVSAPIEIIPNGIDLKPFEPMPRHAPQRAKTVLFLGRLHPKKGIDLLLHAWSRLSVTFPEWRLVIAGPDEGGYRSALEGLIQAQNLQRVELLGTVVGSLKLQLLAEADIFALPSRSEGFPMALLEAMASRRPIVASRECHLEEIEMAGAGWLCETEADSVTRVMGRALSADESERNQRGAAGRALVERKFQWPRLANQLHELCDKL